MVSQGCCPIAVRGLPGGDRTVPAGGNSTFSGIPNGTLVTLAAQADGETCYVYYWMIDGIRKPSKPSIPADRTMYLTMSKSRTATAFCGAPPPTTLTVTSSGACCPIIVSGLTGGGTQTVPAGGTRTYTTNINTQVTLSWQSGQECWLYDWTLNGVSQGYPPGVWNPVIPMDINYTVVTICSESLVP